MVATSARREHGRRQLAPVAGPAPLALTMEAYGGASGGSWGNAETWPRSNARSPLLRSQTERMNVQPTQRVALWWLLRAPPTHTLFTFFRRPEAGAVAGPP